MRILSGGVRMLSGGVRILSGGRYQDRHMLSASSSRDPFIRTIINTCFPPSAREQVGTIAYMAPEVTNIGKVDESIKSYGGAVSRTTTP